MAEAFVLSSDHPATDIILCVECHGIADILAAK